MSLSSLIFLRTLSRSFSQLIFSKNAAYLKASKLYEKNNNSFVLCLFFIAIFVHRTHEFPFFSFTRPFRKVPARLGFSFVFPDLFHGNHELTLGSQTSLTGHLPVRPVWYQKGLFFLLFSPSTRHAHHEFILGSQMSIYISQL